MVRHAHRMAWAAMALFVLALAGFGATLDGYSHLRHAPALLGAGGDVRSLAFNLSAFVVPGLLLATAMFVLRSGRDSAAWPLRLGLALWLLSALAFAAMGVFALDASSVAAAANRHHAAAWSLWWMAFAPGALMLASGVGGVPGLRRLRWPLALAALLVPATALLLPGLVPVGAAQRLAFVLWFACLAATATAAVRARQP
ncbi:DUF998 domain-containing protein [Marilutibacter spongiae]|uniref:DUF998 domain-containing protein n=1 Tax=Marilutibacter spongiae TaxID=2025720 RepID=A0A7W3TMC8_9GAMM|nr:DUF998 domain-containing protein [Lysobacter spongiae]MBB1061000.1 DUF998 domain-containing protein [Lysobacter spongiae]